MPRTIAVVAVLAAAGLMGCGGGSDAGPATTSTSSSADPAIRCDEPVDATALDDDLAGVRDELIDALGLAEAPAYDEYRLVCDSLGATSARVPVAWADELPGPADPPRATITLGPDLSAPVDEQPVVGVGASRLIGEAPAASFVNGNNAAGSLENGGRTLPRRGDSVADGCTAVDPIPFRAGGSAGEIQPYRDCDGEARGWLIAAAFPEGGGQFQTQLIGQALSTADLDALLQALVSLRVDADHVPAADIPPPPALGAAP